MMPHNVQQLRSLRLGIAVGAVAFGLVYLPSAFAGNHGFAKCKDGQTKMCDNKGRGACVKNGEITGKENLGWTYPAGGGINPCARDPISPT
jgi:hypothetical protein